MSVNRFDLFYCTFKNCLLLPRIRLWRIFWRLFDSWIVQIEIWFNFVFWFFFWFDKREIVFLMDAKGRVFTPERQIRILQLIAQGLLRFGKKGRRRWFVFRNWIEIRLFLWESITISFETYRLFLFGFLNKIISGCRKCLRVLLLSGLFLDVREKIFRIGYRFGFFNTYGIRGETDIRFLFWFRGGIIDRRFFEAWER